tara:strand:+ start:95 stop:295 length:201 start_codon:yes stop_codon:yes gene_type:complete
MSLILTLAVLEIVNDMSLAIVIGPFKTELYPAGMVMFELMVEKPLSTNGHVRILCISTISVNVVGA